MSSLNRKQTPATKDFRQLIIPQTRKLLLDNGIPLIVLDSGSQEVNRLSFIWDGGICETAYPSTASLAVSLMREGTNRHSGAEISEIFEFNGAWIKSAVHSHHSSIVAYSLNSKTDQVFPILSETICEPVFPERETVVIRDKMVRKAELDNEKVDFHSALANRKQVMGEKHPLAQSDTPEIIQNITPSDLKQFHDYVFSPSTCSIYLSGRITPQVEDAVNRNFGFWKAESGGCKPNFVPFIQSDNHTVLVKRKGSLQSAVRMAIPTIGRQNKDYIALRIAVTALGGFFGSRLMSNIREDKGYTYGISASLLGYSEGGVISIGSQCDNKYVDVLTTEVRKEVGRMTSDGLSDEELSRLKKYMVSQLAATLDSPFSIMDYYENMRLAGTPADYFESQLNEINEITSHRIKEISRRYLLDDNIFISICGDI